MKSVRQSTKLLQELTVMKVNQLALAVVIGAVIATAAVYMMGGAQRGANTAQTAKETALERVLRTGVLRCGYYVFPPETLRDPNTRALSGLAVDIMERIAKNASIKIEWTEEVDFGNWMAGLKAGRFDAMCTPMWPEPALAREVLFTRPMNYSGIYAYARYDDHRFDGNLAAVNDPSITVAAIEGTPQLTLAQDHFPKARLLPLPQNAPGASTVENVVTKKADVFLWDDNGVHDFLASNPNSVHNIDPGHPLKVMPFELVTNMGESALRDFLDVGLQSLEDTGVTNTLLDKWERMPGNFYRMAKPYVLPAAASAER
jgi:ABC-type amino acid transport substrate-binding protein